jgi:dolichol-phosphate mannosyltransferase
MDADLQDPPELLKDMYLKLINENLDIVYAERKKSYENFFKKYSSILFYKFFNFICSIKIPNNVSDFKIVNKKIINELKKIDEKEPFYRGMIPWLGLKSDKIEFSRPNRIYGKSGTNIKTMINLTLNAIFNYSNFPRRLALFLSLISFLFFIYTLFYFFKLIISQKEVPDLILIFTIIFFFNSLFFFILGIISEYVGKIFFKINNNTLYVIDEKI